MKSFRSKKEEWKTFSFLLLVDVFLVGRPLEVFFPPLPASLFVRPKICLNSFVMRPPLEGISSHVEFKFPAPSGHSEFSQHLFMSETINKLTDTGEVSVTVSGRFLHWSRSEFLLCTVTWMIAIVEPSWKMKWAFGSFRSRPEFA